MDDAEICGDYIIRSFSNLSERSAHMILDASSAEELIPELNRIFSFMEWSITRLLGISTGPLVLADRDVARELFTKMMRGTPREEYAR